MGSLLQRIRGREERSITSIDDYIAAVSQVGMFMQPQVQTTLGNQVESIAPNFASLAIGAHGGNGVVFSVMAVRQLVFSAIRFRYQRMRDGKPSDTFGSQALSIFERPWTGGTTQDLLSRTLVYADLAGNSFSVLDTPLTRLGGDDQAEIVMLRPDWIKIVASKRMRPDGQLGYRKRGYIYWQGGQESGADPVPLLLDEVAHFMPMPDPLASFRGMSWLTPVIREIENDSLMNRHKRKFFENGATPNMIIKHATGADREAIIAFDERMKANSAGVDNAYKTLNLYPGADATVVGSNLEQLDFRQVQGAGETRIAAAGGTPPVIVGLSEGLAAATYSNYGQARRRFGDGTMHPLWQNVAGSFELLAPAAPDARLWYDADDVPFLREDEKDAAEIQKTRATTISSLITAGYEPDSVVKAVDSGDFRLLKHTGLFSVQLQRPGADQAPGQTDPDEVTA